MSFQSTTAQQSMLTRQTITAMFDRRSDAIMAVEELVKAGIPRTSVKITPEADTVAATTTTSTAYDTTRDDKGFWASLESLFMPDEDRATYAEAMHRGSIMVAVTVDQAHAERAEDILEQHGTVNLDEREASWRKEGWSGAAAAPTSGLDTAAPRTAAAGSKDAVIPVYEEKLNIGKRQVNAGRVKIRSYVVETPVSEQVSLRTETVQVDRRPVDRAVTAGDDAFRERTIEAEATSEEAVVQKDVRVKEEIGLRKVAEERTQTVSDKVRRTEVEIEDGKVGAKTTSTDLPKR